MSTETTPADDERSKWSPWAIAAAALLLLMFGVIAIGTLRGCFFVDPQEAAKLEDDEKKKKEDEKKAKKDPFEINAPVVLPAEGKVPMPLVKPGHWATASQVMQANERDFVGDSRVSIVDSQNRPYPVAKTPFTVRASRPVLLTKGRPKSTETTFFVPITGGQAVRLITELEERGLGLLGQQAWTQLTPMPSYQYNFVVLAKEPSRYAYVKTIDAVKVPFGGETESDDTQDTIHYSVTQLKTGQSIPLADNPLTWTTTAYLLWDEVDPGDPLTADQERAIVDWIHWGGQLIINGPDSLDLLKGSFLEPYLPATSGGPRKIAADDPAITALNEHWMIPSKKGPDEPLKLSKPWSAITLVPYKDKLDNRNDARPLPDTSGLLVERQIGRGRIVVSAMQLSERDLVNWRRGFESLFNACILRRPRREYKAGYFDQVTLNWADADLKTRRLDAALNTNLRYFARDLGVDTAYHFKDVEEEQTSNPRFNRLGQFQPQTIREYQAPDNPGGIGAWNDFSATADAARGALREAAGVEVPGADFVVLCLAAYLIALVPLNWLIFHTLGRIEWAWIAAPVIAIAGTWIIVQRAQLDIGFVRAQTEIGVLELQPDLPRGHLSRYTALYTSLSTTYDFDSPNTTTLITPFPTRPDFEMLSGQSLTGVSFRRYDDVQLVGLPISSNSTGMAHTEQMHSLDGPICRAKSLATGRDQVENHTKLELHSACVVWKVSPTAYKGVWIGDLLPGQSAPLPLTNQSPSKVFEKERADEGHKSSTPRLNLEPMIRLALDPKYMEVGEMRLVGRVDNVLPGETITPAASQIRGSTLVVAHLQYALPPAPQRDVNTRRDIKESDNATPEEGPIEL